MTKREKTLGLYFLAVVIVAAHLWGFNKWQTQKKVQQERVSSLSADIESFDLMDQSALVTLDEVNWVNEHPAPVMNFQEAQSELLEFLVSSGKSHGFTPVGEHLFKTVDEDLINEPTDGDTVDKPHFQRVKIQISAKATEEQIYKWLVEIHQTQKMRIVSELKFTPDQDGSQEIKCDIIAEQFISNQ